MATYRIEWADGRVDLASSFYAARALVLARFPGASITEQPGDGASVVCWEGVSRDEEGRRAIAVIHCVD